MKTMKKTVSFDQYRRRNNIIEKAKYNPVVSKLIEKHNDSLYKELVKTEIDKDTYLDTYMYLTNHYDPKMDFCEQFKYTFHRLRMNFIKDSKHCLELNEMFYNIEDYETPESPKFPNF